MDDKKQTVWACKIGFLGTCDLPDGADAPMRKAVREAFERILATDPQFIFSGWAATLTESELAVVEGRLPRHAAESKTYNDLLAERDTLRDSLAGYIDAVTLANLAMQDGINVHGALAGLAACEEQARAALLL